MHGWDPFFGGRNHYVLPEVHGASCGLVVTMRRFGIPHSVRTDNEASFCSLLLRGALRLLGVRHKAIAPHSPWQNGRIERLFGTFKDRVVARLAELRATGAEPESLQPELDHFRLWYNHVRIHQHLDGLTPAEAWDGLRSTAERKQPRRHFFSAWEGLLTGFH
jgi:transposase InsO family protein